MLMVHSKVCRYLVVQKLIKHTYLGAQIFTKTLQHELLGYGQIQFIYVHKPTAMYDVSTQLKYWKCTMEKCVD